MADVQTLGTEIIPVIYCTLYTTTAKIDISIYINVLIWSCELQYITEQAAQQMC